MSITSVNYRPGEETLQKMSNDYDPKIKNENITLRVKRFYSVGTIDDLTERFNSLPETDICSRNYIIIRIYKRQLGIKDFNEAKKTCEKLHGDAIKDIALRKIALCLAEDGKIDNALLLAFDIFETVYRHNVIKEILLIAKTMGKDPDSVVESFISSAIYSSREALVMRTVENISAFIPDEKEKNEFLLTCVRQMKQQCKYKMAVSILNCLSPETEHAEVKEKYRKIAFRTIFNAILAENDIRKALKLLNEFKEMPVPAGAHAAWDNYNYSNLCDPLLVLIVDLLLIEDKFDLIGEAVRLTSCAKLKISLLNNILARKKADWKILNYQLILSLCETIPQTEKDCCYFIDSQLNTLCKCMISNNHYDEAEKVANHIWTKKIQQTLLSKIAKKQKSTCYC